MNPTSGIRDLCYNRLICMFDSVIVWIESVSFEFTNACIIDSVLIEVKADLVLLLSSIFSRMFEVWF